MSNQLRDDELKDVVGGLGEKTGDVNKKNEVYIRMPGIAAGYSGWYTCAKLESLADTFIGFASQIAPNVTADIKDAVNKLYALEGKTMTANVKAVMGL